MRALVVAFVLLSAAGCASVETAAVCAGHDPRCQQAVETARDAVVAGRLDIGRAIDQTQIAVLSVEEECEGAICAEQETYAADVVMRVDGVGRVRVGVAVGTRRAVVNSVRRDGP